MEIIVYILEGIGYIFEGFCFAVGFIITGLVINELITK